MARLEMRRTHKRNEAPPHDSGANGSDRNSRRQGIRKASKQSKTFLFTKREDLFLVFASEDTLYLSILVSLMTDDKYSSTTENIYDYLPEKKYMHTLNDGCICSTSV